MPHKSIFPPYPRKPHKSGQARVSIGGRHIYLGPHGSDRSLAKYRRLMAEWQAARSDGTPGPEICRETSAHTVAQLTALYVRHVEAVYIDAAGRPGTEVRDFALSARPLVELHGGTAVRDFGPLALQAVRQAMIGKGWCRKLVNQRVKRLVRMFRWGVSQELIDEVVYRRLATVEGLRAGRTAAPDHPEVEPAPPAAVDAVLPRLGPVVRAMVTVQRLTGMRPGEVCRLTPGEIDRGGANGLAVDGCGVWVYRPAKHKNAWRGHRKAVVFGPQAQAALAPFVEGRGADVPCFSPAEEVAAVNAARRAAARTPRRQPHGRVRPGRAPAAQYTTAAYGRRIARACALAGVARWTPHQLRHLAEVDIERRFDLDAARAVLGHRDPRVTIRYGKQDLEKAARVAAAMG